MPQTPNHGYNVPTEGEQDWHVPLNENFEEYDTDIEIRDTDTNKGNYDPKAGAKFLATDTETVYVGDGTAWNALASTGRDPDVDSLTASGQVAASDLDVGGGTVFGDTVVANDVSAGAGITTPSLNESGDNLGIGTSSPATPLDVKGENNWNLDNVDGDVRIGNDDYRLAIGVALGGAGAGNVAMRAKGGDSFHLGAGGRKLLTLEADEDYTWDAEKYTPVNFVGFGTSDRIDNELIRAQAIDTMAAKMVLDTTRTAGQDYPSYDFAIEGSVEAGMTYDYDDEEWRANNPYGAIWIDSNGDFNAFGNKNFVQSVETDEGEKEVVYTSTEAPTARTEASGVAVLDGGRAVIELPDHFGWVTDEDEPIHVQTTPYSVDSSGLAVVERTPNRLVVEDLDGEGDYEFSYTVRGTREGHADKEVVRDATTRETDVAQPAPADD